MPPNRPKKKNAMTVSLKLTAKERTTKKVSKQKITLKSKTKSHSLTSSRSDTATASSRKRSSSASSGGLAESKAKQTRREKQKSPQDKESDAFSERKISARTRAKWKPVQKSTKDVVVGTIDGAIMSSLNHTSAVSYTNVQEHLNVLRTRLLSRLTKLKAPAVRYKDYKRMDAQCKFMEEVLVQGTNQKTVMKEEADKLEECLEKKDEELVNVDESIKQFESNGAKWKKKCHPTIIDHFVEKLGIPPLPDDRDQLPFPQIDEDPRRSRLLNHLTDFSTSDGVQDLTKFVENVATVANILGRENRDTILVL